MAVRRGDGHAAHPAVIDRDLQPVSSPVAHVGDATRRRGVDAGAAGRAEIGAVVQLVHAGERMRAHAERRGDAWLGDRPREPGAPGEHRRVRRIAGDRPLPQGEQPDRARCGCHEAQRVDVARVAARAPMQAGRRCAVAARRGERADRVSGAHDVAIRHARRDRLVRGLQWAVVDHEHAPPGD